jgi:hypothetical protein
VRQGNPDKYNAFTYYDSWTVVLIQLQRTASRSTPARRCSWSVYDSASCLAEESAVASSVSGTVDDSPV